MGKRGMKGLSVNAIVLIIILTFVNFGFAVKMYNKYYKMQKSGYLREKPLYEQLEQRVMKAFGYKEAAEIFATSFKEQGKQLKSVSKKFEKSKTKFEEENASLQMERWALEDS